MRHARCDRMRGFLEAICIACCRAAIKLRCVGNVSLSNRDANWSSRYSSLFVLGSSGFAMRDFLSTA